MGMSTTELRTKVETAAILLGASKAAILKWRQRGVPSEWQIKIVSANERHIKLKDFELLEPKTRRETVEAAE